MQVFLVFFDQMSNKFAEQVASSVGAYLGETPHCSLFIRAWSERKKKKRAEYTIIIDMNTLLKPMGIILYCTFHNYLILCFTIL